MKRFFASAVFAVSSLIAGAEEEPGKFIRVDEDDSAARLQTGVTRYVKDGKSVDLIGAVHIADRAYFEGLNERFKGYDALLFEMVGGERIAEAKAAGAVAMEFKKPEEGDADSATAGLHGIYTMVSKMLKLSGQSDVIDYMADNFVHADLTDEEFAKMQEERGETILGFAMKANAGEAGEGAQPDAAKIMQAMLSGNTNALKLELVHTLGKGGDQIAALSGESVIITDRNARCIEVMDRELAAGKDEVGIFYGAAHFPEMEERLLEKGFVRKKHEWVTAWDIPKPKPKAADEDDGAVKDAA